MSAFCRRCGHSTDAHVEGGGPCTWRGAAPIAPCPCDAFQGDLPAAEAPTTVDRERFLADAERAFRICYPERWEMLVRAVERNWPTEPVPAREPDQGFQQISIEAPDDDVIQQVEIDAAEGVREDDTRPITFARTPADEFLDRVRPAAVAGNWLVAFDNLREALNVRGAEHARPWLAKVFCETCNQHIAEPAPGVSTAADYARFWRGRCPRCQSPLVLRGPGLPRGSSK
ncbi:MAG TPA: hypothetical protein VMV18_00970 [bacterium]|nr:hypothetical protein [bacterium]